MTPEQEREAARIYVADVARAFHLERFTDDVLRGWGYDRNAGSTESRSVLTYHARRYARSYPIGGPGNARPSSFMLDMRRLVLNGQLLSVGQVRGVLNVILADAQRHAAARTRHEARTPDRVMVTPGRATPDAPAEQVVADGYYTIVLSEQPEVRRTLRVKSPREGTYARSIGRQYVAFLDGPDNVSSYRSFATLDGAVTRMNEFRHNWQLGMALELLVGYAQKGELDDSRQRFALVSGRCWNCGRMLTVPTSIHRGLGPDCAARLGAL
jgi:hypothetical protein